MMTEGFLCNLSHPTTFSVQETQLITLFGAILKSLIALNLCLAFHAASFAAEQTIPLALKGIRLGMAQDECLEQLMLHASIAGNAHSESKAGEGDWAHTGGERLLPELKDYLRRHGYSARDRIFMQTNVYNPLSTTVFCFWGLFTEKRCDRLLLVAQQVEGQKSPADMRKEVEEAMGQPFPEPTRTPPEKSETSRIEAKDYSATIWRRIQADGVERIVIELAAAGARKPMTKEELNKKNIADIARLKVTPEDRATLKQMPPFSGKFTPFPATRFTVEEYAEKVAFLRKASGIDAHIASGRGPRTCLIYHVGRNGFAAKAGIQEGDSVLRIDGALLQDADDYTRLRHEESPQQQMEILARDGQVRTVTVGPGKIGINYFSSEPWLPVAFARTGTHGAWDDDAIAASLAINWNLSLAEQALAVSLDKGWDDSFAHQLAARIHCERGRRREAVEEIRQAIESKTELGVIQSNRNLAMLAAIMSTEGWYEEASAALPWGAEPDSFRKFVALRREMPAAIRDQDLSEAALSAKPGYDLLPYLQPVEEDGKFSPEIARMLSTGKIFTWDDAMTGTRLVWDGVPDLCEFSFTFNSEPLVYAPEIRVGPNLGWGFCQYGSDKILSQSYSYFWIHADGDVMVEMRHLASTLFVPTVFRADGSSYRFRMVRWGYRVRLDIDGLCINETLVNDENFGSDPNLVLWMTAATPGIKGTITDFTARGFGDPPAPKAIRELGTNDF
jgi:hypothetical protein